MTRSEFDTLRSDLAALRKDMESRFTALRTDMDVRFARLESKIQCGDDLSGVACHVRGHVCRHDWDRDPAEDDGYYSLATCVAGIF
jgi:hypothetical protein